MLYNTFFEKSKETASLERFFCMEKFIFIVL
jgi:hypothetical protein